MWGGVDHLGLRTRGEGRGGVRVMVSIDFWVTVCALVTDIPLIEQAFILQQKDVFVIENENDVQI